jgi:hypothetical protein
MKYLMFYFLDLGGAAEGKIGINYPNIVAAVIFIVIGFTVGKLI